MNQAPMIMLRDVHKSYRVGDDQVEVLKGISLSVQPGEFIAIMGASGNGKSTLLNMITGIDHPTLGDVIVNGAPIHTLSEDQLARWRGANMGIVFQFFQLLPSLNLLQNVLLPQDFVKRLPPKERKARAMHLLERVGLAEHAHKLPSMVSGGQQQRAAIARALANDPPVIVADEPTGNLDAQTSAEVFDLFTHLVENEGKTLVMVTHSAELAAQAGRVVAIVNGGVARNIARGENDGRAAA